MGTVSRGWRSVKKSLLVVDMSPGNKWFQTISQGAIGLASMFISLLLLVQFYQFTPLKLIAWLLPMAGLGFALNRLWKAEQWIYRRVIVLPRFLPQRRPLWLPWLGPLILAFWLLLWLSLWREIRWLGVWQYLGGEMLLRAVSAFKAPMGHYELATGEWLGQTIGDGPPAS